MASPNIEGTDNVNVITGGVFGVQIGASEGEPVSIVAPPALPAFTVATVPAVVVGAVIYVSDANTGAGTIAFGKGTSWIDIKTGSAVS